MFLSDSSISLSMNLSNMLAMRVCVSSKSVRSIRSVRISEDSLNILYDKSTIVGDICNFSCSRRQQVCISKHKHVWRKSVKHAMWFRVWKSYFLLHPGPVKVPNSVLPQTILKYMKTQSMAEWDVFGYHKNYMVLFYFLCLTVVCVLMVVLKPLGLESAESQKERQW